MFKNSESFKDKSMKKSFRLTEEEKASVNYLLYALEMRRGNLCLYKKRWKYESYASLAKYIKEALKLRQELEELVFYRFTQREVKNAFKEIYKVDNEQAWNICIGFTKTLCTTAILSICRPTFVIRAKLLREKLREME